MGKRAGREGQPKPCHLEGQHIFHRNVEDDVHVWGAPGREEQRGVRGQAGAPELPSGGARPQGSPAF